MLQAPLDNSRPAEAGHHRLSGGEPHRACPRIVGVHVDQRAGQAYATGTIKLTDPVNKYLPPESQIPDQGFKNPIRIVDLMAHAPGMEDSALGHLILDKAEK